MKNKKYKILKDDFILHKGKKLYRIRALKKFIAVGGSVIEKGQLGGYIEGYHNLSQENDCWVFKDAKVYDNASVKDLAIVDGMAEVFGNARVRNDVRVGWHAKVYGNAIIRGRRTVVRDADVYGNAIVEDGALLYYSEICDNAIVKGTVVVKEGARILNNASIIMDKHALYSFCHVEGAIIYDNAKVKGQVSDDINKAGSIKITSLHDKISNNSIIYLDGK